MQHTPTSEKSDSYIDMNMKATDYHVSIATVNASASLQSPVKASLPDSFSNDVSFAATL